MDGFWLNVGGERAGPSGRCPRGHAPDVHADTDVVCHLHDRALRRVDSTLRGDLVLVELAHLPLYLALWLALRDQRGPAVVVGVVVAGAAIVVHLRRYTHAPVVAAWVYAVAAAIVGWRAIGAGWPSPVGFVWFVALVATGASLWATRSQVGALGAAHEPVASLARSIWARPGSPDDAGDAGEADDAGDGRSADPVGARATTLFVLGVGALVLSLVASVRRPGSWWDDGLAIVGLLALVAGVLQLWTAVNAVWGDAKRAIDPDEPPDPEVLPEPAHWDGLTPGDRAVRRFGLRVLQSTLLLLPWLRTAPGSQAQPPWSRTDRMAAAVGSCIRYGSATVGAAVRCVVAPLVASMGVVLLAGTCGRLLATVGTTDNDARTMVEAVLFGAAAVAALAVVVRLLASTPLAKVLAGVTRTALVVLPNTLVRMTVAVLVLVGGPGPLAVAAVVLAFGASLAVWVVRNAGS